MRQREGFRTEFQRPDIGLKLRNVGARPALSLCTAAGRMKGFNPRAAWTREEVHAEQRARLAAVDPGLVGSSNGIAAAPAADLTESDKRLLHTLIDCNEGQLRRVIETAQALLFWRGKLAGLPPTSPAVSNPSESSV